MVKKVQKHLGLPRPFQLGRTAASTLAPVFDGVCVMNATTTFSTNQEARPLSSYFSFDQIMPSHAVHFLSTKLASFPTNLFRNLSTFRGLLFPKRSSFFLRRKTTTKVRFGRKFFLTFL